MQFRTQPITKLIRLRNFSIKNVVDRQIISSNYFMNNYIAKKDLERQVLNKQKKNPQGSNTFEYSFAVSPLLEASDHSKRDETLEKLKEYFINNLLTDFADLRVDIPHGLLSTTVETHVEYLDGSFHVFHGRRFIEFSLFLFKIYLKSRSYARELVVNYAHVNKEDSSLDLILRLIMLPKPKLSERILSNEQILSKLEERAIVHDFRMAIFVNQDQLISQVFLTKFNPTDTEKLINKLLKIRKILDQGRASAPMPMPFEKL